MSNFSRQFFCLGLSHTSWPTFVGCGSNNNLVFRAPVVLFWSGTLTCCWWSSCLLLEFLFDFCRCCPWSGIPFPRPSAARWKGGKMMLSSQTAPLGALRAAWRGRVLCSVTDGAACRDGRLLSRPHSATRWEVGDTRPWGRECSSGPTIQDTWFCCHFINSIQNLEIYAQNQQRQQYLSHQSHQLCFGSRFKF